MQYIVYVIGEQSIEFPGVYSTLEDAQAITKIYERYYPDRQVITVPIKHNLRSDDVKSIEKMNIRGKITEYITNFYEQRKDSN